MVSEPIEFFGPKSMAEEQQPLIGLQKKLQEKKHTRNLRRLKYSCEEVYERMDNGLCIFCDELDTPGHHDLKHKGIQIFMVDCDDEVSEDKEEAHQETMKNPEPFIETKTNVEPETMKTDPFIEPLKHTSALQVPDSVNDVLLFHKMGSLVKEVGEVPQQSTSGNGEMVAHQLFDQMPLRIASKEKQRKYLKACKFKFKPTSKRSKLMDVKFFSVEEIAWFMKGSKEINWGCVKKEFKETMAACGKKTIDRLKLVDETSKPAVYDGPIQIHVWENGGSPLERVDEESSGDVKLHLKHKWRSRVLQRLSGLEFCLLPTKLDLRDWPKGESKPHKKKSHQIETFEVLSSLEPSRRCRNDSLDVVDERMCNELVCEEDGDSIITMSAKFGKTYEDPRFELVCLKQSHDPVENHLDNIESALTRSSLRHAPTYQYRAPFNPYQNCSDQSHYKREFGNYTGPGIEFDRASEEVEDDELQDKQPEDEVFGVDVETLVMNEDEKPLECDDEKNAVTSSILCDYNMVCDRKAVLETEKKIEVSDDDEIVSLDKESDLVIVEEIVVASVLKFPTTFTCMRVLGHYKIRKTYILIDPGDAASGNNIQTGHMCGDLENWSLRLEDDFYKIKNQQQQVNNRKVILRLVIPVIVERAVKRKKDYDGALLAPLDDTVAFSGLDVQQLCKQQLDTLLKLVRMTVVPFGTLILMTCKIKKLRNAEDDVKKGKWRFSEDIKLGKQSFSEYIKLIYFLELVITAFISQGLREEKSWTIFIKIMKTFSPMIKDTHWDKEAWVKLNLEGCKGGSLLEFLKKHEARVNMIKVPNNTKFFNYLKFLVKSYILRIEDALKGCKFVKFTMERSEKPLITIFSYEWFHSPRPPELSCCKEDEESTAWISSLRTRMI